MRPGLTLALGLLCAAMPATSFAGPLDEMISPVTNPVTFEDPRANSELRAIFANHEIDDDFVTSGGTARIYALQIRYAVDDRLAILATKDGYVDLNVDEVLSDSDGFADLSAGVKYAFYKDDEAGRIVTAGLRYEIPTGDDDVFQGQGDGALNPFISAAAALGPVNVMLGAGFRSALDDEDSSFFDADIHFDTKIGWFHPCLEFGVINVTDAGKRLAIPDEGEDFFNFGSSASDGNTLVTGAVGGRAILSDDMNVGLAYQFPLSDGDGSNILDWRVTADFIYSF